ncbi:MAG TPA: hypothetical protein PK504_12770 [Ferruginibacter sp.]|nr:hypothetical protein [Ferruginibacter sp.]
MKPKISTILLSGLTAGILDIITAIVVYAGVLNLTTTQKILQSIAAGALGKNAFSGGWFTAFAGLVFHFLIATIFAAIYLLVFRCYTSIFKNKWVAGFLYGIVVWAIMNLGVLPLVANKTFVFELKYFLISITIIIVMVGIPISIITDKRENLHTK